MRGIIKMRKMNCDSKPAMTGLLDRSNAQQTVDFSIDLHRVLAYRSEVVREPRLRGNDHERVRG